VSEMVSDHNCLYMNLMGHTHKEFRIFRACLAWLHSAPLRSCSAPKLHGGATLLQSFCDV
jgi:hypothetical protein